jgi:hypothetical protein
VTPEQRARQEIDRLLAAAGWAVQDFKSANLYAARGVALREFVLDAGQGFADYLLYVDGKACGVIEAKKQGATLTGVEISFIAERYKIGTEVDRRLSIVHDVEAEIDANLKRAGFTAICTAGGFRMQTTSVTIVPWRFHSEHRQHI